MCPVTPTITPGDNPVCNICGSGQEMSNPDGIVTPKPGITYACGCYELLGQLQHFNPATCIDAQQSKVENCGCTATPASARPP